jgi:hypothetical protein
MSNRILRPRWGHVVLASALAFGALGTTGCRVTEDDVHRWSSRERGPDKIVAVLTHDKYDLGLRTQAALELVRMKPRNGRRIGVGLLTEALANELSPDERKKIVAGVVPELVRQMKTTPAPAQAGAAPAPDASIPYKDAAFALLTYDKATLVADEAERKKVSDALAEWCLTDFERRIDDSSQMFGVEQVMRALGAPAAKGLPPLIGRESEKYDRIAGLVAEIGDPATKDAAATKLVDLAKYTSSQAWIDRMKPGVEERNKAAGYTVKPDQLAKQLAEYQDDALTKVLASVKKVGSRPAVEYCLGLAADKSQSDKRRQAAVAALEGRLDRSNPADVQRILALAAADDTPDAVRDLAFQRVGEMPREQVVGKLFELFAAKKWKVRYVSAGTVLKMSTTAQLPEFMSKLPSGPAPGFAMTEPLFYGGAINAMQTKDGKSPRDAVVPFLREGGLAAKLTALGWFYAAGGKADLALLAPMESDSAPVPKTEDPDAKWQCEVPKADGKETEVKPILTVGEFVKFCVEPAIQGRG